VFVGHLRDFADVEFDHGVRRRSELLAEHGRYVEPNLRIGRRGSAFAYRFARALAFAHAHSGASERSIITQIIPRCPWRPTASAGPTKRCRLIFAPNE
jgi:hypothetical protein